jgi:hypothetical protein
MHRLILALVLLPTLAVSAPALKEKAALYYPTQVGDTLVYETDVGGKTTEHTEIIDRVEEKEGVVTVQTVRVLKDVKRPVSKIQVSERGVLRVGTQLKDYPTPMTMLKLPAKAGDKWESNIGGAIGNQLHKIVGEEEVKVPAGTYNAIRVEMTVQLPAEAGMREVKQTHWFAPGVGVVKISTNMGGSERVQVLKSFTPGKK